MKIFLRILLPFSLTIASSLAIAANVTPVSIYGAKLGKKPEPRCREVDGQCFILDSKAVVLQNYTHAIASKAAIRFEVQQGDAKKLRDLSRDNLGGHLAIVIDDQIVSVPKVKALMPQEKSFVVSFCNEQELRMFKAVLDGEPAAHQKLKAKKELNCTHN